MYNVQLLTDAQSAFVGETNLPFDMSSLICLVVFSDDPYGLA